MTTKQPPILAIFLIIEGLIYTAFLCVDIFTGFDSSYIRYAGILVCFAMAIYYAVLYKSTDSIFVAVALLFTCIADYFLLEFIKNQFLLGVIFFVVVQLVYLSRIYLLRLDRAMTSLLARCVVFILLCLIACIYIEISWLVVVALLYFVFLVGNVIEGFLARKYLFAIALTLLMLCDICVGINNIGIIGVNSIKWLRQFAELGMWLFYLPSQVLVVLSTK